LNVNVKLFRRQRKLRGGQDPRELQRLGVEARRRRKAEQGSGVVQSTQPRPEEGRASRAGRPMRDSSISRQGPHGGPQLPKTKPSVEPPRRRTTEDVLAEINAAYAADSKAAEPPPKPSGDLYTGFPRQAGETTSDYQLRHILHQQAEWREIQRKNGTLELEAETWPRLIASPEQFYM
jgi:hypothetical protein